MVSRFFELYSKSLGEFLLKDFKAESEPFVTSKGVDSLFCEAYSKTALRCSKEVLLNPVLTGAFVVDSVFCEA